MFESKYSKLLTVLLVIVIIAILGLLGYLAYEYYQNYVISTDANQFVDDFNGEVADGDGNDQNKAETSNENPFDQIETTNTVGGTSKTYKGFGVLGTIEIPSINLKYPVLDKVTPKAIEIAVAFLYGTGLNKPGNSVIIGHNYRNGLFFSNLKKVNIGEKIYITDVEGNRMTYTIYNKFEAAANDTSFYQRDTGGKPEITLSTCTDDSSARIIVFGKTE